MKAEKRRNGNGVPEIHEAHIRRLAPAHAAVVPKPFTLAQLTAAIEQAVAA